MTEETTPELPLRQIFNSLNHSSDKWDNYFGVYERHLLPFNYMSHPLTIVEVGVQKGGSLEMWGKYFGGSANKIIGVDIDPECAKLKYDNPNIQVVIADQNDPNFWDKFLAEHKDIDIFIDDGGHFMDQQITTFEKVFPKIKRGVYICEDCHTSYMHFNGGGLNRKSTFIEYSKSIVDCLHKGWWEELDSELDARAKLIAGLTSVHFYNSIVVFEKYGTEIMKRVAPKWTAMK